MRRTIVTMNYIFYLKTTIYTTGQPMALTPGKKRNDRSIMEILRTYLQYIYSCSQLNEGYSVYTITYVQQMKYSEKMVLTDEQCVHIYVHYT